MKQNRMRTLRFRENSVSVAVVVVIFVLLSFHIFSQFTIHIFHNNQKYHLSHQQNSYDSYDNFFYTIYIFFYAQIQKLNTEYLLLTVYLAAQILYFHFLCIYTLHNFNSNFRSHCQKWWNSNEQHRNCIKWISFLSYFMFVKYCDIDELSCGRYEGNE